MADFDHDVLRPEALSEHRDAIRALARSLVRDAHLADDVAQSALVQAIEHPPRVGPAATIAAWLRAVLRNEARRQRRGEIRRRAREIASAADAGPGEASPADEIVARFDAQLEVMNAVKRLEPAYREVILLRFFEDLPPRKIAARLNAPVKTIDSRLARALARLRRELDADHRGDRKAWLVSLAPLAKSPIPSVAVAMGVLTVKSLAVFSVAALVGIAAVLWVTRSLETTSRAAPPSVEKGLASPVVEKPVEPSPPSLNPERKVEPSQAAPSIAASEAVKSFEQPGRFIDPDGAAIPSALLVATSRDSGGAPAAATTDEDGRFTFETGEGTFSVASGKDRRFTLIGDTQFAATKGAASLVVLGAPAVELRGVAVDEQGAPLAAVGIRIVFDDRVRVALGADAARTSIKEYLAETSADGKFAIENVAAVKGLTVEAIASGFASDAVQIREFPAPELRFVMKHVVAVRGKVDGIVRGSLGEPLSDVRLGFGGTPGTSDAEGRFHFDYDLKTPPRSLMAVAKGFLPAVMAHPGDETAPWPEFVELRISDPPRSIAGVVLDDAGKPLPKARVWIKESTPLAASEQGVMTAENVVRGGGVLRIEGEADDSGRFRITGLLDRDYELMAIDPRRAWVVDGGEVHAGKEDVVVRFPKGELREKLEGRVVDRTGAPVVEASVIVECSMLAATAASGMKFYDTALGTSAVTDEDGRFELKDVPSRDVKLRVDRADITEQNEFALPARDSIAPFVITVGLRRDVRVELVGSSAVEFAILDAAGRALDLFRHDLQAISSISRGKLFDGRSEVLSVSDAAAWLVLYDASGRETKKEIRLKGGELNVLR